MFTINKNSKQKNEEENKKKMLISYQHFQRKKSHIIDYRKDYVSVLKNRVLLSKKRKGPKMKTQNQ